MSAVLRGERALVPMRLRSLERVLPIERAAYAFPWTRNNFRQSAAVLQKALASLAAAAMPAFAAGCRLSLAFAQAVLWDFDEATANVAYLREMLSRKDKDNSRPPGSKATIPVAALNRPD